VIEGCITCARGAASDATNAQRDADLKRMAAVGAVHCTRTVASFHGPLHRCERFAPAESDAIEQRITWWQKKHSCILRSE
jgi:hypothetical protein